MGSCFPQLAGGAARRVQALALPPATKSPPGPPRHEKDPGNNQRQAEHRRSPIGISAGSPFPRRELNFAGKGHREPGDDMMTVVRIDRRFPPSEVGQPESERPDIEAPVRRRWVAKPMTHAKVLQLIAHAGHFALSDQTAQERRWQARDA